MCHMLQVYMYTSYISMFCSAYIHCVTPMFAVYWPNMTTVHTSCIPAINKSYSSHTLHNGHILCILPIVYMLYMVHMWCILVIYMLYKVVQHVLPCYNTVITDFFLYCCRTECPRHRVVLNLLKYVAYCITCITPTTPVDLNVYYWIC